MTSEITESSSKVLGKIKEIYIYPIKSLPGIKIEKGLITKYGVAHPENLNVIDRKWMIIDKNGTFKTQRNIPKMALINVSLKGNFLALNAPNKNTLNIPVEVPDLEKINCRVWKSRIDGYLYSKEIGDWLSDFLETEELNLVGFRTDIEPVFVKDLRNSKSYVTFHNSIQESDCIIYSDYSPLMIISENSLVDLNTRLVKKLTMRSFRPVVEIQGCAAYDEDSWTKFHIGATSFHNIKPCTRCVFTTVCPEKGVKDPDMQPLKKLKEYRIRKDVDESSPIFGICVAPDNEGHYIKVGDEITENS